MKYKKLFVVMCTGPLIIFYLFIFHMVNIKIFLMYRIEVVQIHSDSRIYYTCV